MENNVILRKSKTTERINEIANRRGLKVVCDRCGLQAVPAGPCSRCRSEIFAVKKKNGLIVAKFFANPFESSPRLGHRWSIRRDGPNCEEVMREIVEADQFCINLEKIIKENI
ncbi:MAG: hypothetical protein ACFFCW_37470 [Candidatus Hodarchaeota archaeon]